MSSAKRNEIPPYCIKSDMPFIYKTKRIGPSIYLWVTLKVTSLESDGTPFVITFCVRLSRKDYPLCRYWGLCCCLSYILDFYDIPYQRPTLNHSIHHQRAQHHLIFQSNWSTGYESKLFINEEFIRFRVLY